MVNQALRFVHDVLGEPDRADEIANESLEDYAERQKIQLQKGSLTVAARLAAAYAAKPRFS